MKSENNKIIAMTVIDRRATPRRSILLEQFTLAIALITLILMGVHQAVAGPLYNEYTDPYGISNLDQQDAPTKPNNKPIKKVAKKVVSSRSNNMFPSSSNLTKGQSMARKTKKVSSKAIDNEIAAEADGLKASSKVQVSNPRANSLRKNARKNVQAVAAKSQAKPQVKATPGILVAENDDAQKGKKNGLRYIRQQNAPNLQNIPSMYAMSNAPKALEADSAPQWQTGTPSSTTKIETPKPDQTSPFTGSVNFTIGHDSNIDPEKTGVAGTYYQFEPTLGFTSGDWSGSFGGSIKDFSDQAVSDTNRTSDVKANMNYATKLGDITTTTTTVDGAYHDEMWPDYINGPDVNGYDHGMPVRYTDGKITEKLGFDFGNGFSSEVGGYYMHREASSVMTDFAAAILDPRLVAQSFNEYQAFGKVAYSPVSILELALRPTVTERDYTEREGRQPDGSTGGWVIGAPLRKLLTTELNMDMNFKWGKSSFGPTGVVGQVSDEVYGGENANYFGGGVKGDIIVSEDYKITLSPSAIYKQMNFDNWTYALTSADGSKRVDEDMEIAINGKIMITKNIGWMLGYAYSNYRSNFDDTSVNYKEELVTTTAIYSF